METVDYTNMLHIGRKIERVRRLRGMTQTDLGTALGISKQAVSKIEQTEQIDTERIKDIAKALGVTEDGLKNFHEEHVLYNTNNFYENCGVTATAVNAYTETFNNFPIEKVVEMFEKLLQKERDKFERIKSARKK